MKRSVTVLHTLPMLLALALPALALTMVACGGNSDDNDNVDVDGGGGDECATSTLTYANFGESFMTDYCVGCHAAEATPHFAPNLENLAQVQASKDRVDARAGVGLGMPPTDPRPSAQERADLTEWISCGAP